MVRIQHSRLDDDTRGGMGTYNQLFGKKKTVEIQQEEVDLMLQVALKRGWDSVAATLVQEKNWSFAASRIPHLDAQIMLSALRVTMKAVVLHPQYRNELQMLFAGMSKVEELQGIEAEPAYVECVDTLGCYEAIQELLHPQSDMNAVRAHISRIESVASRRKLTQALSAATTGNEILLRHISMQYHLQTLQHKVKNLINVVERRFKAPASILENVAEQVQNVLQQGASQPWFLCSTELELTSDKADDEETISAESDERLAFDNVETLDHLFAGFGGTREEFLAALRGDTANVQEFLRC